MNEGKKKIRFTRKPGRIGKPIPTSPVVIPPTRSRKMPGAVRQSMRRYNGDPRSLLRKKEIQ